MNLMRKLNELLRSKKGGSVLVILAVAGMALIFLSTLKPQGSTKQVSSDSGFEYADKLESELAAVVCKITGEKDARVFISLESSEQKVYADALKRSNGTTENTTDGSGSKKEQKDNTEQSYIIVEDSDGKQEALVVTTVAPVVRGVVVVSSFADNSAVSERIVEAVTTALNISSKKVCVVEGLE